MVVNLGNALNAIIGQPLDSCMKHRGYRRLLAAVWEEGVAVAKAGNIRLEGVIQGQPLARAIRVLRLPTGLLQAARYIRGVQDIDPSYHSSMFYDLESRRETEVNELNERVVEMGKDMQIATPINELLSQLTREAQIARRGSPRLPI